MPNDDITKQIRRSLLGFSEVCDIHHLHFWSLDGDHHVMTVHLVLDECLEPVGQIKLKDKIASALKAFELEHTTIEFEFPNEPYRDQ